MGWTEKESEREGRKGGSRAVRGGRVGGGVERGGSLTTAHQVHDKPKNVHQYQAAIS